MAYTIDDRGTRGAVIWGRNGNGLRLSRAEVLALTRDLIQRYGAAAHSATAHGTAAAPDQPRYRPARRRRNRTEKETNR